MSFSLKLPEGQAFACPRCDKPMDVLADTYALLWCRPCDKIVDSWYDPQPEIVKVDVSGAR